MTERLAGLRRHLGSLLQRIRQQLQQTNPVLIAGVFVFLIGFGLTLANQGVQRRESELTISQTFNHMFEAIGARLVPSVLQNPETRLRFNILILSMIVEGLPPDGRDLLETALAGAEDYLHSVFGLSAFVTLLITLGGYGFLTHAVDRRLQLGAGADEQGSPGPDTPGS